MAKPFSSSTTITRYTIVDKRGRCVLRIGKIELTNPLILSPMAGVTDLPFRLLCKEMGCAWVVTEMISAKALLYENPHTWDMLKTDLREYPAAVQLFGNSHAIISEAAKLMESAGFAAIDINMGCPAKKVVKNGEGAALLLEPGTAALIIRNTAASVRIPITVKMRAGFDNAHINAVELAKQFEDAGAAAITIHPRTGEQYFSGRADWEIIRRVKKAVSISVIGNGDVTEPKHAYEMMETTGCDGVMIGRAALGNPWIFREILQYARGESQEISTEEKTEERIETALRHCRMAIENKGQIGLLEMRKHLCRYTKGMADAAQMRQRLCKVTTYEEVEEILRTCQN